MTQDIRSILVRSFVGKMAYSLSLPSKKFQPGKPQGQKGYSNLKASSPPYHDQSFPDSTKTHA